MRYRRQSYSISFRTLIKRIALLTINREELSDRHRWGLPENGRRPWEDFHDRIWLPRCNSLAAAASSRMGRPLTTMERRRIWRARTPLVLSIALDDIERSAQPNSIESIVENLPQGIDRPDPTN